MNRHILLIVKVILIVAAAIWSGFAAVNGYYFQFFILMLLIALLASSIIASERRIVRRVKYMMSCIRDGDLSVSFPEDTPGLYGELNKTTNQALSAFRTRIYNSVTSEAETEAWQKLIRVLGHEIMNSLAPIISLSETMTDRGEGRTPENGGNPAGFRGDPAAGGSGDPAGFGGNPAAGCSGDQTGFGGDPESERREYLSMLEAMKSIHRRSTGLLHFVENYRRLTRIPDPIKRFFTIGDLFAGIRNLLGDDHPAVDFTVRPSSARLYADRSLIEQVILNIIKNSIEAAETAAGLRIRIDALDDGESVAIRIGDNGPGISAEGLDKIFVPFYTTKQTGSGIGLSVSRQIMSLHGGTITAESPPSGGAVITLRFDTP